MTILTRVLTAARSALILGATLILAPAALAEENGKFEGRIVIEQLDDGQTFVVREPLAFIDPLGVKWPVPQGAKTNCASVPQFAWTVFPPCRDRHLKASVVHDHFCVTRDRPWQAVHRMFYDALRAAGVGWLKAQTMYAAVYQFGPRWDLAGAKIRSTGAALPEEQQRAKLAELEAWIAENKPSIADLEKRLEKQTF